MGLLVNDSEWSRTLTEASLSQSPRNLRKLFAILIVFCDLSDAFQMCLDHKSKLAEDYLYNSQVLARERQQTEIPSIISDEMYGHCLLDLNDILMDNHRFDLKGVEGFGNAFPEEDTRSSSGIEVRQNSAERLHAQLYQESLQAVDPDTFNFNDSQKLVYDAVKNCALDKNRNYSVPNVYFVDGPGGTGKTFLFNALLDAVRRTNKIAISVASSGTAALLLKGGRTAHSVFRIPLEVTSRSMCDITPRCDIAKYIKEAQLIVWDECSMISKHLIETVDRTFKDILKSNVPFGGRLIVFGGDFRQVLPVIPKASRSMIITQCLNRANFWPAVKILKLEINMRVQQALASNDTSLAATLQYFADYLLKVGEGKIPTVTFSPNNIPSDFIPLQQTMHLPGDNLLHLIQYIYPNVTDRFAIDNYFIDKAILTPKNKDVATINNLLLNCIPGRTFTYLSCDEICEPRHTMEINTEYLNAIELGSLPPHSLQLKVGTPNMVIRNIDPAAGLCNGTRLIVKSLGIHVIEAAIATGPNIGDIAYISKTKFIFEATQGKCSYDFKRIQFPVRLAFSMTINKSQGQTLGSIGLYLPCHVFGHGQLYVALSRVRTPTSVRILIDPAFSKIQNKEGSYTHNIVYTEVF
ncbi:unnamed protein product [Mucor hiemalis]